MIELHFDVKPLAKQSFRYAAKGCYQSDAVKAFQKAVKYQCLAQTKPGDRLITEPISLSVWFNFKIPKTYTKAQIQKIRDTDCVMSIRPDIDNLCKALLDALNGVLFADDSIVVELHAVKRWQSANGIDVTIIKKEFK